MRSIAISIYTDATKAILNVRGGFRIFDRGEVGGGGVARYAYIAGSRGVGTGGGRPPPINFLKPYNSYNFPKP